MSEPTASAAHARAVAPPPLPAVAGMSEAERPTGPLLGMLVALLSVVLGQLLLAPLALIAPSETFLGQLILTLTFLGPLALLLLWVRGKERRPVASLGFRGPAARQITLGAAAALALTAVTVLVNLVLGTASLGRLTWGALPAALVLLLGFAIQSSTEEIVDRGYALQAVARRWGLVVAMILQTVLFAALHGANGGLTWVAWANLCGVAVLLGLWVWVTGSLWGACAFHTVWNWSQGSLWGAAVSNQRFGTSLAHYMPVRGASPLLTGGGFGLEGSLIPILGFALGSLALILIGRRRHAPTGRIPSV